MYGLSAVLLEALGSRTMPRSSAVVAMVVVVVRFYSIVFCDCRVSSLLGITAGDSLQAVMRSYSAVESALSNGSPSA